MKLTTFILIISLMQVSAASFGQNLTLKQNNVTITKVFFEIRKQTGYDVLVENANLKTTQRINANFNNTPLSEVMNQIVNGTDLVYTIEDKTVVIKNKKEPSFLDRVINAFNAVDIRGRVIGEDGAPIAGANVNVKGTSKSAITNQDGAFYIAGVDEKSTLVISYVGYVTKEVAAAATTMGSITLVLGSSDLQEVTINKGYYTTTKELNTGSIGSINATDIAKQPINDPLMSLAGRISGLYINQSSGIPGGFVNVILRGQNSIANGNNPYYVIDGIPFNSEYMNQNLSGVSSMSPFTSIRPNDIEKIEVLKDADATAIYGSKGANGVILITTKKGMSGRTNVDLTSYTGVGNVSHKIKFMNTEEYLEMRREAFKNDNSVPSSTQYDVNGIWDSSRYTDWQNVMIGGTSNFTDFQATISGGNSNTNFRFGGGGRIETTVFPGDYKYKIGSYNMNLNHTSTNNKFNINFNTILSYSDNYLPQLDFTKYIEIAPDAPSLYNSEGELNWQNSTFINPFAELKRNSTAKNETIVSGLTVSYKLFRGLTIKSNLGYTLTDLNEINITPFTSYNPALKDNAPLYRRNITSNNKINGINFEPQINYIQTFKNHHFEFLLGTTFQEKKQNGSILSANGFTSDALIDNPLAANTKGINGINSNKYRYSAIYARLGYNYKERYILNLTGRRDGSSRFGAERQFGNFGALAAGWIFSKESFIEDHLGFLSSGKIRGSLGVTGNDQLQDYQYLSTYSYSGGYMGITTLNPDGLTNPLFGWETIKKYEIGLDLGFLDDRVLINTNWFRHRTGNQLVGYPLSTATGFSTVTGNLPAVVQNTGFEFELSSINIKNGSVLWSSSINISFPKNRLISFPNIEGSSYNSRYVVGKPLSSKLVYQYEGIDKNTGIYVFKDLNSDGQITSDKDKIPVAFGQKYFGGIDNSLSYKNWNLDILVQFVKQMGYNYIESSGTPGQFYNLGVNQPVEVLDRWRGVGGNSVFQKFTRSSGEVYSADLKFKESTGRISDASYLRLKNIMLSWQLPDHYLKKLKVEKIRLYFQGQNLLTFTKFKGLDPETQVFTSTTPTLPTLRLLTAGLQITL